MAEKIQNEQVTNNERQTKQTVKRERHEFILTVNGFIVCQRYFHIDDFNRTAYSSVELVDTIDECVRLIDNDLKSKSIKYIMNSAPQVFENKEEADAWLAVNGKRLDVPSYVMFRDDESVGVWNGEDIEPYDKFFNKSDYITTSEPEKPWVLKFAFLDYGREVASKVWDGNVYPRFVRINIDLSNSKNRYEGEGMPYDSFMMKNLNEGLTEIISTIVDKLQKTCSYENKDDYSTIAEYGDRTYNLNVRAINEKYIRKAEAKCRKKTEAYFKSIGMAV